MAVLNNQTKADVSGDSTRNREQKLKEISRSNTSFHNVRYLIIFVGGMTCGSMFFTRLGITIAMIKMVNHTYLDSVNPTRTNETTLIQDADNNADYPIVTGEFNWPNVVQQFIISGYMIAYVIPQFFTTRLTIKYGLRRSIPISLFLCGISCLLTPLVAYWGWGYVLALRLLNGLGASSILPTAIGLVEIWMPYNSSTSGLSLLQFVQTILYTCTPLFSGYLAGIHWKWAFYVPGATAILFCIIWILIVRDDPENCTFISDKEILLIKGIVDRNGDKIISEQDNAKSQKQLRKTDLPWYFMFKIRSFHFFVIVWLIYCATFGGFLNLMPSYLNRALSLTVEENGLYNFIIQVGVLGSMLWANPIIATLQHRCGMSLSNARKLIVFVYTLMSILTWTYMAIYHDHQIIAICLNRFFHMTNDTILTATLMSQFGREGLSSTVYSMMNSFGNPGSVIFCSLVGKFLDQTGESLACWSWVFHSMSILNVILLLVYVIFLDSEAVEIERIESKRDSDRDSEVSPA